jgi:hypothetical protein
MTKIIWQDGKINTEKFDSSYTYEKAARIGLIIMLVMIVVAIIFAHIYFNEPFSLETLWLFLPVLAIFAVSFFISKVDLIKWIVKNTRPATLDDSGVFSCATTYKIDEKKFNLTQVKKITIGPLITQNPLLYGLANLNSLALSIRTFPYFDTSYKILDSQTYMKVYLNDGSLFTFPVIKIEDLIDILLERGFSITQKNRIRELEPINR